ncbi:eukaryotic translation initiation factor 4 gamma 2-like [Ptychodera flava]|uniref:eukaryotic translation initiation factor 4 gamma 2-like n=1 Tax=Ptychodera flava TaxID=63121 RepID=UPI003969F515
MLGNIKFMGELGKLDLLHESILHRCIKQLLEKKKTQSIADMGEDLECLCKIMRTVGPRLDTEKAKALMDQYFVRMQLLANNVELPSRIRFMLEDTLELRANYWKPRKVLADNSPRTIEQIRQEAAKDYGVYIPYNGPNLKQKNFFGGPFDEMDSLRPQKRGGGLSDVFMPTMGSSIGTGPGVIQDSFNGYSPPLGRPRSPRTGDTRNANGGNNPGYQNYSSQKGQSQRQDGNQGNQGYQNRQGNQQRDMPPRFMKKGQFLNSDEISLRPAKDSMVLKPQAPSMMPASARPSSSQSHQPGLSQPTPQQMIAPPQPQNQQSSPKTQAKHSQAGDKPKQGKKKILSKEELKEMTKTVLDEFFAQKSINNALSGIRGMKAPRKYMPTMVCQMLTQALQRDEEQREGVSKLIGEMKTSGIISDEHYLEGFQAVLDKLPELEADVPLVKSYIATAAARAVIDEVVALSDLGELLKNGTCYPLFLLILQQIRKVKDKQTLVALFKASKIDMQTMLPELDQTKERMMEILEDKQLSFLYPLLRMQSDIWKQMKADPNASTLYKWLKDSVDSSLHTDPGFVFALTTSVLKYCTMESTLSDGVDTTAIPDKQLIERERSLLNSLKPLLQAFVHDQIKLQLSVLYALQAHCYNSEFPKGMLLRFFVNFYDMEVVEEEVFLKWREDINDQYPGKGKCLFQVNSWLTWLETADEEEESDDEDDD